MVPSKNASAPPRVRVVVYSHNPAIREQVMAALGTRPDPGLPELEYVEVASHPALIQRIDAGGISLAVLDGEAVPAGGLGVAKQLKDEVPTCPPIVVLTGRADDAWLARWSGAEAAVSRPIDPFQLIAAVVPLLKVAQAPYPNLSPAAGRR